MPEMEKAENFTIEHDLKLLLLFPFHIGDLIVEGYDKIKLPTVHNCRITGIF